jgi:hypothetical protein
MKARIVQHKHTPSVIDRQATQEELLDAVFSMWSMLRLCNEDHWEKLASHEPAAES